MRAKPLRPGAGTIPKSSGAERARERRLLSAASRGDRRALAHLADLLSGPVFRFGQVFCGNRDDAEDVMQETLAALVRGVRRFRGDAMLSTWAYVVARNACRRMRRRTSREIGWHTIAREEDIGMPDRTQVGDDQFDPSRQAERHELTAALMEAIRSLPAQHREALILRDVEGLSAAESARIIGIGERALKSRLHRARQTLRTLRPWMVGGAAGATRTAAAPSDRGCPDTAAAFSRYLEGELSRSVCAEMERHLARCEPCRHDCTELRSVLRQCRRSGRERPPIRVRRAVRAALTEALAKKALVR